MNMEVLWRKKTDQEMSGRIKKIRKNKYLPLQMILIEKEMTVIVRRSSNELFCRSKIKNNKKMISSMRNMGSTIKWVGTTTKIN